MIPQIVICEYIMLKLLLFFLLQMNWREKSFLVLNFSSILLYRNIFLFSYSTFSGSFTFMISVKLVFLLFNTLFFSGSPL